MQHVRQTDLIRLAADELVGPRRAEVERHLADCPQCEEAYRQQVSLWAALGEWTPDAEQRDVLPAIERALQRPRVIRHPLWSGARRVSRVAAAIVLGAGGGYLAARVWSPPQSSPVAVAQTEETVSLDDLGVEFLADESPAGLFAALQDISAAADIQEDQS